MSKRTLITLLVGSLVAGCTSKSNDLVKTPSDELAELRVSLAGLREQESAKISSPDLEKAASHLGQAEAKLASGDADDEDIAILIALARSQMVLVKSMVARALAEEALERLGAEYQTSQERLRELEAQQETVDSEFGETR